MTLGAAATIIATAWVWPAARVALLYVTGRCSICSYSESRLAVSSTEERESAINALTVSGRLLETDGEAGMTRWSTEYGEFWLASEANPEVFWRVLAEQSTKLHDTDGLGVRAGDVVLDCGANYGTFTREALEAGAKLVVAIEPVPQTVLCLRRTFAAEIDEGRVIVVAQGVWDKEDRLRISVPADAPWISSFVTLSPEAVDSVEVPLTPIDGIVAELRIDRVDLIKMDIEGAEKQAIEGAKQILRLHQPRMAISVNHLPDDPTVIPALVRRYVQDYRTTARCKDWGVEMRPEIMLFY